jgi:hypothetical protein
MKRPSWHLLVVGAVLNSLGFVLSALDHLLVGPVRLTQVRCVTCFQAPPPPFTLVKTSTTARVAERQTRRT